MRKVLKRLALLSITVVLAAVWSGCAKKTTDVDATNEDPEGKLLVTVVDKTTKKPITDAKVIISGMENDYATDAKGVTQEISLKVNKDIYKKYGESLYKKAPSGSVTLLVTKDGYKDYIIFDKVVYPGYTANTLKVELTKLAKSDTQKFVVNAEQPHNVWIQELVDYCKNINEENAGTGTRALNLSIKDANSKAVEGVYAVIPELNLKVKTDKNGKCTLNPDASKSALNIYPVQRDLPEYTVVLIKEGYEPKVIFNATVSQDKDSNLSFTIKALKGSDGSECAVDYLQYENDWVEKVISNLKG